MHCCFMFCCAICTYLCGIILLSVSKLFSGIFRSPFVGKCVKSGFFSQFSGTRQKKFRRKLLPYPVFVAIMSFGTRFSLSLLTNFFCRPSGKTQVPLFRNPRGHSTDYNIDSIAAMHAVCGECTYDYHIRYCR